ncbi:hypothetical protein SAMN05216516_11236 [Izhakiella capsodis]|uniref:Uncharacterized protein n=1 Tax=Izhakiella capsodis TaxID=1367852 RepID=A0A1I5AJK8_9GAMM|nr:hypothetical protein SAMN05216516_11236 [Izhakiella capsodis]
MVSFSNNDGAHCDFVTGHYTLPSNSIQMDVKVPFQPSNFDALQKGPSMGAHYFSKLNKIHKYQYTNNFSSNPVRGARLKKQDACSVWFFLLFIHRFPLSTSSRVG